MEWSEPKLWRIETGQTALRALDVQAMCAAYGAEPGLTRALAGLAAQTRADGWWRAYGGTIPDDFGIYTALEDAACALTAYAPSQIPSLLHTEAYARTLISSTGLDGEEVDRLVYDCLARRVLLTRSHSPLTMTVALDEALVRRPVGGPAVMAGQLRFLADMAAQPNVCLRVVPYTAGLHPGLATGAFTLLHFPPSNRDTRRHRHRLREWPDRRAVPGQAPRGAAIPRGSRRHSWLRAGQGCKPGSPAHSR